MALGLEPICFVIKGDLGGAFDLMLELFCSQATSTQPQVWHSHLIGLGSDCQLFKILLQHSKSVALVQSEFEFKKGATFLLLQKLVKPIL